MRRCPEEAEDSMMHWILQENMFREAAWEELLATLDRFGFPYSTHKIVPFVGELIPEPPPMHNAIAMGAYSMRHAAKKADWYPGVFDLMESGNFQNCLKHWGEHMLNHDSVVVPFKDVSWPSGEERFIRPTDDSKYFAGKLIEADEFRDWQRNVCVLNLDYGNSLTADTLIQVVPFKKIYAEYRCWVVKGKIVTMSLYKLGDSVIYKNWDYNVDNAARDFAQARVDEWQPADSFVIDVCEIAPENEWRIVEVNTLNSCGFYACNMQKLVMALHNAYSYEERQTAGLAKGEP